MRKIYVIDVEEVPMAFSLVYAATLFPCGGEVNHGGQTGREIAWKLLCTIRENLKRFATSRGRGKQRNSAQSSALCVCVCGGEKRLQGKVETTTRRNKKKEGLQWEESENCLQYVRRIKDNKTAAAPPLWTSPSTQGEHSSLCFVTAHKRGEKLRPTYIYI